MGKKATGLFACVAALGILTGCGKQQSKPPQPAPSSAVQQITSNEAAVGKQYQFSVAGVSTAKGVALVQIDGQKDGEVFNRVGVALGAIANVNLTSITTVAVEYSAGKKPLLVVSVPYKTLEDYRNHKITQSDLAKEMKIGVANSKGK